MSGFEAMIEEVRFGEDSPLEGAGQKLSQGEASRSEQATAAVNAPEPAPKRGDDTKVIKLSGS
jgi:hypothetical protein